ncbi:MULTISPECIES: hypothetical protein [unclassified Rathayibacter]|uniref:hypothetical protein n=1 Tax=unclassified Rathayibacter TaxID=2609250 RepID=UPI0011AFF6ED|nr:MULTISPECIES: hypothetical protein [unclassified Rathayibacter]
MSIPSRARIAATSLIGVLAVAGAILVAMNTGTLPIDQGVRSAFAIASLTDRAAVEGRLSLLGIDPEDRPKGRVSVFIGVAGAIDGSSNVSVDLPSRLDGSDAAPTAPGRQAATLVIGGDAAEDFEACDPSVEASIWTGLSFTELSPTEQTAIVTSIDSQLQNREARYGRPHSEKGLSAIDIAAAMSFTLVEPTSFPATQWEMVDSSGTDGDSQQTQVAESVVEVRGNAVSFQCDVPFTSLWTAQATGPRFEIPALVVNDAFSNDRQLTNAEIGVFRIKELSESAYSSSSGLDDSTSVETWPGLDGTRIGNSALDSGKAEVALPDIVLNYTSSPAAASRDARIFLSGILFSLFGSMLVAVLKQVSSRKGAQEM